MINDKKTPQKIKCGLIMPISGTSEYSESHWIEVTRVIKDSLLLLNKHNITADVDLVSHSDSVGIIQAQILQNIIESDILICDVSGKNPNVMFELGLSIAFDKPLVIIKDEVTDYSFDTSPIQHLEYKKDLKYDDVKNFLDVLSKKIKNIIFDNNKNNSYLKTLGNIKKNENDLNITDSSIDIFNKERFDSDERLFLLYAVEQEINTFNTFSSKAEILEQITRWESKNNLNNIVSTRYFSIIKKLIQKNFLIPVEFSFIEEQEYSIPLEKYLELKRIFLGNSAKVNGIKLSHKTKNMTTSDSVVEDAIALFLVRNSSKSNKVIRAQASLKNGEYTVLNGSMIELIDSNSIPNQIKKARLKSKISSDGILEEDVVFSSPSAAAAFVVGGYTNGRLDWKTINGKSLKAIQEESI